MGLFASLFQDQRQFLLLACGMLLVLFIYAALSPRLAYNVYRPRLFHPLAMNEDFAVPTVDNVKAEECKIAQSDGTQINGWFFRSPGAQRVVLFSHGNGGNMSTRLPLIEALLRLRVSVFAYDYSGYGKSSGLPSPQTVCDNAVNACDYLIEQKGFKPEQIVLYGESLGAAVSAELATARKVRGLIIQSGFVSLYEIAKEKLPILSIYPDWLFPEPRLDTGKRLAQLKVPVLIFHGVDDQVVPYHHGEDLFRQAIEPKKFVRMPATGHVDLIRTQPELFYREVGGFLSKLN